MKSITLHGLDPQLDTQIREEAKRQNLSQNKAIKKLLAERLGLTSSQKNTKAEFADIFGVWSKRDEKEFNLKTQSLEKIDHEDW